MGRGGLGEHFKSIRVALKGSWKGVFFLRMERGEKKKLLSVTLIVFAIVH